MPNIEHRDFDRLGHSGKIQLQRFAPLFREIFSAPDATFVTYNPSATIINPPNSYRAFRIDASDGRTKSMFFRQTEAGYIPNTNRIFDLEDPFASNIDGEILFGGTEVDRAVSGLITNWRTVLYRGFSIPTLEPFFVGPDGMKDIRPILQANGKLGVYTRPRNLDNESLGGDGQIGFWEFDSLDDLATAQPEDLDIHNAPLLSFRFPKGEWGGVNHAQVVKEGRYKGWNLPLIHRARKEVLPDSKTIRHYRAGALLHNPETGTIIDLGDIAERKYLPAGPWKDQEVSEDLQDVFFPGELVLVDERKALVIGGMSDAETGWAQTLNPLLRAP